MIAHQARKRLGQHFLRDASIVRRIVAAFDPQPSDRVVEIGPGHGVLTREMADKVASLHAIEVDRDLAAGLATELRANKNVWIHNTDALTFDFCQLADPAHKLRMLGNLPYNISTPLLFRLLEQLDCIRDMCFMLQKEVVERLSAKPNSKAYGRLGVMVQRRCEVEQLFTVKPAAFVPAPRVDSAIVRLRPYATPPARVVAEPIFARLVNAAFAQRRKTLRNALRGIASAEQMAALGIDPGRRGESLSLKEFALLSNAVANQNDSIPRNEHKNRA